MSYREKYQYILVFVIDAVSLVLSVLCSKTIWGSLLQLIPSEYGRVEYLQFYLILAIAYLTVTFCFTQNGDIIQRSLRQELCSCFVTTLFLGAAAALLMVFVKLPLMESRYLFCGVLFFHAGYQLLFHQGIKILLKHPRQGRRLAKLVGVLTVSERAEALLSSLRRDWTKELCGIALLDIQLEEAGSQWGVPVKADFSSFMEWVRREALDEIYVDIPYDRGEMLAKYLIELESMGLDVYFSVPLLKQMNEQHHHGSLNHLSLSLEQRGDAYLIGVSTTARHDIRGRILKRLIDIIGSLVGIVISIPIILLVAIPLKLESPGPLIFKQKRVGLNGRQFHMYKLRSMYADAEVRQRELESKNEMVGPIFKVTDDPRITKVGHFLRMTSIDELPQFFNVLRGDMSLVGTRPPTIDEYDRYESHHKRRLSMKPGITGLWQVNGRSNIKDFEEIVRLDAHYIDYWSLMLDFKIMLKTVGAVLSHNGAE